MKKILIFLYLFIYTNSYTQKDYLNINLMGQSQYFGIGWEKTYLNNKISHEFSIGLLSGSVGLRSYFFNEKIYIGYSQILQLIPYKSGWKTYPHIGLSAIKNNTRFAMEISPIIEWWDRTPNYNIGFGLKFSKYFL